MLELLLFMIVFTTCACMIGMTFEDSITRYEKRKENKPQKRYYNYYSNGDEP